jgi:hypothetical protein
MAFSIATSHTVWPIDGRLLVSLAIGRDCSDNCSFVHRIISLASVTGSIWTYVVSDPHIWENSSYALFIRGKFGSIWRKWSQNLVIMSDICLRSCWSFAILNLYLDQKYLSFILPEPSVYYRPHTNSDDLKGSVARHLYAFRAARVEGMIRLHDDRTIWPSRRLRKIYKKFVIVPSCIWWISRSCADWWSCQIAVWIRTWSSLLFSIRAAEASLEAASTPLFKGFEAVSNDADCATSLNEVHSITKVNLLDPAISALPSHSASEFGHLSLQKVHHWNVIVGFRFQLTR